MKNYETNLDNVLKKVKDRKQVEKSEIVALLSPNSQEDMEKLYVAARATRKEIFEDKVFLYGFVYFSTFCRNDCNFCYYRKSNSIERYRKTPDEIVELAKMLAASGVNLIDLTMGEDMQYHNEDFESILEVARRTKKETGLPIMISPGLISNSLIEKFADLGAEWYALYQETHNRELYGRLRINQSYDERMNAKLYAKEKGMHIEEGLLVGVGETIEDIADSIIEMGKEGARQIRVMSFVPQKGIPMEHQITPSRDLEYNVIAAMRILYPEALIPASLDVDGISGLRARMNSGANVITSIIPPMEGLMGVAQNTMDVDDGGRSVPEVLSILKDMGLKSASNADFMKILNRKE